MRAFAVIVASIALPGCAGVAADAPPAVFVVSQAGSVEPSAVRMADVIERFSADQSALRRTYGVEPARSERFARFRYEWSRALDEIPFESLDLGGKVDYTLLRNEIARAERQAALDAAEDAKFRALIPFQLPLGELIAVRGGEPLDYAGVARKLTDLKKQVDEAKSAFEERVKPEAADRLDARACARMLEVVDRQRDALRDWFEFYNNYDPLFTWWAAEPYKEVDGAFGPLVDLIRDKGVGNSDDPEAINGVPIGREALLAELEFEMIPYTPEELIAIAQRELDWCTAELKRASNEMGFGDDWRAALDRVKQNHVQPGEQPKLIRDLANEAVAFLRTHDLVTVPELAEETWRMEMMSPERQLVNPFFTGGEVISVSFPVGSMTHEQKQMTLRGNNRHFSRATVHHELIPGHHLQQFMNSRYSTHRGIFSTPFWTEGWALYWEMLLWDKGFGVTPEDRMGMLFWRTHRCARIMFSIRFQLGEMTPRECVDFLVDRVGHERANAEGEVRRSFGGGYGPLYQVAYMIGGLQFRALHREMVASGRMTNRDFHDAILRENNVPVEMVRALITGRAPTRDFRTNWRFDGPG